MSRFLLPSRVTGHRSLVFILPLLLIPVLALGESVRDGHVEAELLSEMKTAMPGSAFWIGVRLRMDPGWHTYWKNPGDTGLETSIKWSAPEDIGIDELQWPAPARIESEGLVSYGYEGDVLLRARVHVPAARRDGFEISGRVKWLVCQDRCIPGAATVSVEVAVGIEAQPDADHEPLLAIAARHAPRAEDGFSFAKAGDAIRLRWPAGLVPDAARLYFFADRQDVLDHGASQQRGSDERGPYLALKPSPYSTGTDELGGVLVLNEDAGQAIQVKTQSTGTNTGDRK